MRLIVFLTAVLFALAGFAGAQIPNSDPAGTGNPEANPAPESAQNTPQGQAAAPATVEQRTRLNLLGQTDTQSGESRRNENIQFNLVDNNLLRELNTRLGTTATIVTEFQADRRYFGSEYGNAPASGLHVAPVTRQGIHGRLFESHSNSVFSARSFFQVGDVRPARENNYGVDFLAPLWRDSILTLQASQQKVRGMVNGNVLVPLPGERTPLAADPGVRAYVQKMLSAYPNEIPNRTDINIRMLNTNAPQKIDSSTLNTRIDQKLTSHDHLTLRYGLVLQQVDAFQFVAGQNPDTTTRSHQSRITWTRQISPLTTLNFSLGFDRLGSFLVAEPNNTGASFGAGGISGAGPGPDIPIARAENMFRHAIAVRQVRGRHEWTAGFDLLRRHLNGYQSDSHLGSFRFISDQGRDAITNLRLGLPSTMFVSVGYVHRRFRNWDQTYYFGDRWRVTDNLTLNYGIRYQPIPAVTEAQELTEVPYSGDFNNFAPQFGFAQRLPGRFGVLRGSYGLQYDGIVQATYQQLRFNPPHNLKMAIPSPDLLDPIGTYMLSGQTGTIRNSLYRLDPNLVAPYSHQYNFSWEPALSNSWRLQLGYVGSRTPKIIQMWYTNRARPVAGIPFTTGTVDDRRPDPLLSEVKDMLNGSYAWYDAARATLVIPRWKGFSIDASYWFSKAIDLGANYSDTASNRSQTRAQWEFDSHRDLKALSDFDQPHAFLIRVSYDAPVLPSQSRFVRAMLEKWNLSGVALVKSGTPFMVASGSDAPGYGNADGALGDRPNLLDPSVLGRTVAHPDTSVQLLPRQAFAYIPVGSMTGNLGRNTFRKGGIANVNTALARRFVVGREKTLQVRAESINFFNTPQFAAPGSNLTDPNFGMITNTLNDGRTFRFLASFEF